MADFINRQSELQELDQLHKQGGLVVIYGRRRVGKTTLINHWLEKKETTLYTHAIQGNQALQFSQVLTDLLSRLHSPATPNNWLELLNVISAQTGPVIFCIDEFPYLVDSNSSLPSIFQRWIDHQKKKDLLVILAGSGQHMMYDLFLNATVPLFGRAKKIICLQPMNYSHFCQALRISKKQVKSFVLFSMVGGIPKYWETIANHRSPHIAADRLFYDPSASLENEPARILVDEKVEGIVPLSLLECIGRGAHKPSEMAARLQTVQTNLSRPLQLLTETAFLERQLPFGESEHATKRAIYQIRDPMLHFWFGTYSPHRSRWHVYNEDEKWRLLSIHAAWFFETYYRSLFPGAARYWESRVEFDCVRFDGKNSVIVTEIKWPKLSVREKDQLHLKLRRDWQQCKLSRHFELSRTEVIDQSFLSNRDFI